MRGMQALSCNEKYLKGTLVVILVESPFMGYVRFTQVHFKALSV